MDKNIVKIKSFSFRAAVLDSGGMAGCLKKHLSVTKDKAEVESEIKKFKDVAKVIWDDKDIKKQNREKIEKIAKHLKSNYDIECDLSKAVGKMGKVLKTIQFPIYPTKEEKRKMDNLFFAGKMFYNGLIEFKRATYLLNQEEYHVAYPERLELKNKREKEYADKVKKEVAEGIRLPKKQRDVNFKTWFQKVDEEYGALSTRVDPVTFAVGRSSVLETLEEDARLRVDSNGDSRVKKTRTSYETELVSEIRKNKKKEEHEHPRYKNTKKARGKYIQYVVGYVSLSAFGTKLKNRFEKLNVLPSSMYLEICKGVEQAFAPLESMETFRLPSYKKHDDDFTLKWGSGEDKFTKMVFIGSGKNFRIKNLPGFEAVFSDGIKVRSHIDMSDMQKIVTASITKRSDRYYLNMTSYIDKKSCEKTGKSAGIDWGIAIGLQLSDGKKYNLPKERILFLEKKRDKMKSRRDRKMVNNSKNYKKISVKINKIDAKIAKIRKYHSAMFATEIARDYDVVCVEDTKISNMVKSAGGTKDDPGTNVAAKSGLNRSILRMAPYMFKQHLKNKMNEYDKIPVIEVNPKNTSNSCRSCGHTEKGNRVVQDKFKCLNCGFEDNADLNAAINIYNLGMKTLEANSAEK